MLDPWYLRCRVRRAHSSWTLVNYDLSRYYEIGPSKLSRTLSKVVWFSSASRDVPLKVIGPATIPLELVIGDAQTGGAVASRALAPSVDVTEPRMLAVSAQSLELYGDHDKVFLRVAFGGSEDDTNWISRSGHGEVRLLICCPVVDERLRVELWSEELLAMDTMSVYLIQAMVRVRWVSHILEGSFSAVPTPLAAIIHSLESAR